MKTSFRHNDKDIYISIKLIDGRDGYEELSNNTEMASKLTNTLIFSNIKSLEIVNDIAQPILTGTIIYDDDQTELLQNAQGNLDLYCKLLIRLTSSKLDSTTGPNEDIVFSHDFYVNGIELLSSLSEINTYKIDIISTHFFTFMENRYISTYTNSEDVTKNSNKVTDLIGSIFTGQLKLNKISDKESDTLIDYISSTNETALEAISNILDNNLLKPNSDLILLPFDHMKNQYDIWFKSDFINGVNSVSTEQFKNVISISIETLKGYDVYGNQVEKMSTKNYAKNTDIIKSTKTTKLHQFNYTNREFTVDDYKKEFIEESLGTKTCNIGYNNRIKTDLSWLSSNPKLISETSNWNNTISSFFFERALVPLLKNGTLLVNTPGNIYRKSGIDMFVVVDSSAMDYSSLLQLQGRWLITRVRHIFNPNEESYKNTMILSRLEIPDDAEKFRTS